MTVLESLKSYIEYDERIKKEYMIQKELYDVSAKLKEIRKKKCLTQHDILSESSLTENKVIEIETYNGDAMMGSVVRYCDAIGIKLSDLLEKYCEEGDTNGNI